MAAIDSDSCDYFVFSKWYWDIVGPRVTVVCLAILNGEQSVKKFNKSHVVLIPKVSKPGFVKEYRPISLCSVMYKIVAKAVALRLKGTLSPLISSFQSAFVPGRAIHDSVMVGFELLHSLFKKNNGVRGFMALKLDMSKAYDRVEWCFLRAIMSRFGFPCRWVDLIMDCVSSAEYAFLVNGRPRGSVVPSRGLRQGCPLSPYLFLFCAEALSMLLQQAETSGDLMGFRCSRSGPRVSHLFFADDSLIFGRANGREAESIRRILQCYERASGQQVNFDKSAITFSPNVQPADRTSVLGILGLGSVATHDKYLGLPTVIGKNKKRTFASICDKVRKHCAGWKLSFFSRAEILINARKVPNYLMSMFRFTAGLSCDKLRSIILQFWWGTKGDKKKIAWVNWDDVCQPKVKGGLGFKDLVLFNQDMVAKQVWRLFQSPDSLPGRVLKHKYFPGTSILEAKDRQGSSHLWSSLIWGLELLRIGMRKVFGDGHSIDAFRDPWIPRPRTFRPITPVPSASVKVHDLIDVGGGWNLQALAQHFFQMDIDAILGIPVGCGVGADRWCWHFSSSGAYTVKSGYVVALDVLGERLTCFELLAMRVGSGGHLCLVTKLVRVETDSSIVNSWITFLILIFQDKPIVEEIILS
uniref:Reverse transcriptase domain-containing protein n=1 Tax=Cannabis sativa TaxID=3483 RepID=A0A803NHI3_CANSA